ncbi:hypothetical protein H0E87_014997 [Populus deltoides]|uniref:Uncharacterized protein n=1 Tax=Populus deltoides TaxID=3696 RepID=A0A8T2Y3D2_POPDE|nr:hypothetical protein H0E87_014997 [Populus deltoides]
MEIGGEAEKRLNLQAPPEGEGGLLRAYGRSALLATTPGEEPETAAVDEETLLLRRSEEGAGCPLSSSLVPATEREKKLLWFKGHRKMRAELGGGRSVEDGLCGDRLVMFLAEGEEKKVCVQRGGRSVWPRVRATKGKMAGAKMGVGSVCLWQREGKWPAMGDDWLRFERKMEPLPLGFWPRQMSG